MAEFQAKYETVEPNSGQRFRKAIRIQAKYETAWPECEAL